MYYTSFMENLSNITRYIDGVIYRALLDIGEKNSIIYKRGFDLLRISLVLRIENKSVNR